MYLSLHSNGLFFNTASRDSETSFPLCKMFNDAKTNSYKRKIGPLPNTSVFQLVEFHWKITEIPDNRAVICGYFYIF